MTYQSGKHHGPTTVKDSYVLTAAANASFLGMVNEVEALIKKEGRDGDFAFTNQMEAIGTAFLHCDAAFAEKLKHLPDVGSVNPEHVVHAQKTRPEGPA